MIFVRAVDVEVAEDLHRRDRTHVLEVALYKRLGFGVEVSRGHGVRLPKSHVVGAINRRRRGNLDGDAVLLALFHQSDGVPHILLT